MAIDQKRAARRPRTPARRNGHESIDPRELEPLLRALEAARRGESGVRVPARGDGIVAELARAINDLAEQRERTTREILRVSRLVGREGRLTERAATDVVAGTWAESLEGLNAMVDNLVRPTTEVARVIDAVALGDLSQKIALTIDGQPVRGEFRRIATTVNAMVDQLSSFADEVTRVAREVGTEGKLGGQARVKGVSGVWKDLTDNVNQLADNLTTQVRNIATVTTAVANGDLSKKITVDVRGEILELKETINTMVDQLRSFAAEVTRVAREVGTEGKLGGQAQVQGVSGVWKDLTDNVNQLADNLTGQVRNIAEVTTAVARGDLSRKITVDVRGEILELKETINTMVDQLRSFADEVTRVAREVGTEGKLGGQAQVEGVSGVWKDLTDNVNTLADNLTGQVRNIAEVTTAVALGDLSRKITVDVRGEILELKETINTMVDQLRSFAAEVTRVAREVGTEGKLGGQAEVRDVSGVWKDLTDNVNFMADSLTGQVRNIAEVTTAVARGDLSRKITVDVKGEILELKETINTMVDQLRSFADEVTRVAREVGTEGKLGGTAQVEGVSGVWKDLTDSVNDMADNLTAQVRAIADVTTAVATGDLSKKITVDVHGEILELKETINTMVDQLAVFADEVTRVAREVGTEGKLGGQAQVRGVSGVWKDLTDNVNFMADSLTTQVRAIAEVTTAVAKGDLSQKIEVDVKGEILQLKRTINTMVDQLSSFADEVTRVAREVGTEGKLGGTAQVEGVSGVWKDLTDNVNFMASSLTTQVRNIADVTTAVALGDLSKKVTADVKGEILALKETINTMVDQLRSFAAEVTRVAREVGTEGKLGGQAQVQGVSGVWKDLTDNVNTLADNLTGQVRNIAAVTTAVAMGDLSKKVTVDVKGEILELKETINTMVDQLSSFADEVTRVAREVGTEGKLGGQSRVKGVSGVWKDLTDNVNTLADNLTTQVRAIAEVTTAVASGDLSQKITVDARGEVAELKNTINRMVDQLSTFAAEVTRVAKEVGTEGQLGGQAEVRDVSGVWKDLTDNVNQLAQTLTTQLRAIAEVSTAVTQGDMSRQITVEAAGEVAELKDNINQMIANLAATTMRNLEQDWLNSNLARFSSLLQGQRDLIAVSRLIMSELTPLVDAQHGAFFVRENPEEPELKLIASFGYMERRQVSTRFRFGEGLVGQAAMEGKRILITGTPEDYVRIASGLGESAPRSLVVLPVLFEDQVLGVLELASFHEFTPVRLTFLEQLAETIGVVINTIEATMRTEQLLEQSQQLAQDLQSQSEELQVQQEELQKTNEDLEQQAQSLRASEELLQEQQQELQQTNEELEEKAELLAVKNREIEDARGALEEKADQLALSSRYKSEFLANMSHELRTPLNSLLILAKLLADNPAGNLDQKQIEFARTIYTAGADLLQLINDILDLSKIEAGKMDIHPAELDLDHVKEYAERTFRPLANEKGLEYEIVVGEGVPATIVTDEQRLLQVVRNLLSNAFKFTERGRVELRVEVPERMAFAGPALAEAERVVAFSVVDTGIGIAPESLKLVFEAFQQADGSTARRFGGTGLGLSISREVARLLGGEIHAISEPGQGSTFTLYVPDRYVPHPPRTVVEDLVTDLVPRAQLQPELDDDRESIEPGDRVVLVVESEAEIARTVLDQAHERGFKAVVALRGDTGLALANEYKPDAIVLDAQVPVLDGWSLLERLKGNPGTRHIPVHVVGGDGSGRSRARSSGAVAYLEKPLTGEALSDAFARIEEFTSTERRPRLLVVEDDPIQQQAIGELIGAGEDIEVVTAGSADEAMERLAEGPVDCMVLDLKLPQKTGFSLLEQVKEDERYRDVPIVIYTGKDLNRTEEARLRRYAEAIVVKGANSPERLLAETSLFLHRAERDLPVEKQRMLESVHGADEVFRGKRVLIVDDDVRNVFALASALEQQGMQVRYAENGREALEQLDADPDVDLILMDIMMPELDGYEATRRIRENETLAQVPIIALTAKAMKGDKEKTIAAGASDYITKPVEVEQLLSLMRVWLYR